MTVYTIFTIVGFAALLLTVIRWFIAKPSNLLVCYLQNFVGSLFIFSGFVKAVDPLGTGYKMHEYFEAFASEGPRPFWEYLAGFSNFFSISMIAAELFVGFMLLIGWKPKFTVAIIWFLTLFFTYLTGYTYLSGFIITKLFLLLAGLSMLLFAIVAIPDKSSSRSTLAIVAISFLAILMLVGKFTGLFFTKEFAESGMKVTDCGCFGDFIKLKPWETFYKDIILDVMILILVLGTKHIRPLFNSLGSSITAAVTAVASVGICLYCVYFNEPIIDFRPYAIGNDIVDLTKEKEPAIIEMMFLYKNKATGEVKEYSQKDFPNMKFDELEYVDRKDKVIDPGIPARILGLIIENEEGINITDTLLHDPNYSLMVVSSNLNKTHEAAYQELNKIAAGCDKVGIKFYAVAVNDGHLDEFRHRNQTAYPFYHADDAPLKTIIRSNPGLVLFKNGVVINKWHYRHFPSFEELNTTYFKK